MLRTLEEWKEFCFKRGTSGDMVYDILKDWEEDVRSKVDDDVMRRDWENEVYRQCDEEDAKERSNSE